MKYGKEIEVKLKQLSEEFERDQQRMRKAVIAYEDTIAHKYSLVSSLSALRRSRKERQQKMADTGILTKTGP